MAKKKKILAAVCAASLICIAAAAIAGSVFSSKGPFSGTVRDENGAGLANVSVSDGRNVVKTDENGNFTLKGYRKSRFISVTVPSGYQTDNFYIPVEKGKDRYDFCLTVSERTAQAEHCFLQISDTEIGENGTGDWLDSLKQLVREEQPAFLIHTGDICYEAGLKKHIEEMNSSTMGCPVYYTIGNHDYVDGRYGEELYESLYGPVWYSFEVGNIHYVVTSFQDGSDYRSGYSSNDRWRWLENDLANTDGKRKVVMFNHTQSPSDDYVLSFDRRELDLKEHHLIAWIFGHYHYNYLSESNGVLAISTARPDCGGIDSSASGARVIRIAADDTLTTEMKYYDMTQETEPENAVWVTELAGNVLFCDTVSDAGFVFTATVDDDYPHTCGIYCLEAETGHIQWFFKTENSVKNNLIVTDSAVCAMDADGRIYAVSKEDGKELWQTPLNLGNALGTSSAMCTDGETLYAGCSRVITALKLQNGEIRWENNRDKGENSPAEFVLADDVLLVNSHWDSLTALDKETGKELWKNKDSDIRFRSSTPAVLSDGTILVADSDAIMLVDAKTGDITSKTEWETYNFSSSGQPVADGNVVFLPTANKGLIAFDLQQETILWEAETQAGMVLTAPYVGKGAMLVESTPVLNGSDLIFGAADGKIYIVSKEDGQIKQQYNAGSPVFGKTALVDGAVIAGTFGGKVVCFR